MISICIIGKNEEKCIETCLKNLTKLGYEIIYVDTGSTDNTVQIAKIYTSKIYDFQWCNDFSKARNYAISKATEDYILTIDCDEFLIYSDKRLLENSIKDNANKVGRIIQKNMFTTMGKDVIVPQRVGRLFNKNYYKYSGIIHEQIVPIRENDEIDFFDIPIKVHHEGYSENVVDRKGKAERNILLLKEELKENNDDPYILYQLGKSYYMYGDYYSAKEYFGQALYCDLNPKLEYVIDLVETYGYSLLNTGEYKTALLLENIYDDFGNNADFDCLMGLVYMNNAKFVEAINMFKKATLYKKSRMEGANDYIPYYNIGVIYECLGDISNAKEYYKKAGNYKVAKERLGCL